MMLLGFQLRSPYISLAETKKQSKGIRINTFFEDLVKSSLIYSEIQSEANNIAERTRSNSIVILK